jgi:hypothetical protein
MHNHLSVNTSIPDIGGTEVRSDAQRWQRGGMISRSQ